MCPIRVVDHMMLAFSHVTQSYLSGCVMLLTCSDVLPELLKSCRNKLYRRTLPGPMERSRRGYNFMDPGLY